ncbi:MAG: M23 family metallopeptidase [Gammaproteobacteria bacterium]|nr:M23 family metallopeptidase [Gammaproteobacteria bacterium]
MKHSVILVWVCLASSVSPAEAEEKFALDGVFRQGGLLRGQAPAGSEVSVDGHSVRVSPTGIFLIGFDRDAPPTAELTISYPDGFQEQRTLAIQQRQYDIQRVDGLPPKKVTPSAEHLARIKRERELVKAARSRDDPRLDFAAGFRWPLVGRISGVYGSQRILNGEPRQPHFGVDVAAPIGTRVVAPAGGVVTLVHPDMYFSGGTLIIDHGHGLSSAFLHLHRILVTEGQRVERGQEIAEVGATGRATGPHLDWRINLFKTRIDPQLAVGPMP